ncbi:MAG TPA: gamma-glutamyltransferase [Chitinophagaceae bacterium]|nr:gamma-glutamyltransferase [Chitinophagaceae bacterium]
MIRFTKRFLFLVAILFLLSPSLIAQSLRFNPYQYTVQKKVEAENGAVAAAHPLATQIGLQMLQKGGNAFDAFIATQWMLGVVYPWAGTVGGGGFMVARLGNGKTFTLDFRETAPAAATKDMFIRNGKGDVTLSQNGHIACGVPAMVAGLFAAHQYAKLPMSVLMQPAIDVAENGFAITRREAEQLNKKKEDFINNNIVQPLFVKEKGWKEGDTLIQKDLAETLKRIQKKGAKGFYEGKTAALIADEMKKAGGLITKEDLMNYKIKKRLPVEFNYKAYKIISMGLPSSGGILLNQMMKMVEQKNIKSLGYHTAASVHLMVEAERRAFADRAEYMGDPDFIKAPVTTLTSQEYLEERMKNFNPQMATKSFYVKAGVIKKEHEETTHVSIIDKYGNCISVTTTLNAGYGSGVVINGTGIIMSNSMDDFSIQPGVPNLFGAIGGEANAIAPNKRMLSSMSPTIVLKNNKPFLILGTPGGTTIPTSVYQVILNIIEFGLSAEDAINNLRFHHQWQPDIIYMEEGFPEELKNQLKAMGHTVQQRETIGRMELIKITDKRIIAVGDKRGDDDARGY